MPNLKEKEKLLNQEMIKEFISYNQETGICNFNERDIKWLKSEGAWKTWNTSNANREINYSDKRAGYIQCRIFNKLFMVHRLIWLHMEGEWPNAIDHINGIRDDNRWCNLRNVSQHDNSKNARISKNNTSGFMGVSLCKSDQIWEAFIMVNRKKIYLGRFKNKNDAASARLEAEHKHGFHENHGKR